MRKWPDTLLTEMLFAGSPYPVAGHSANKSQHFHEKIIDETSPLVAYSGGVTASDVEAGHHAADALGRAKSSKATTPPEGVGRECVALTMSTAFRVPHHPSTQVRYTDRYGTPERAANSRFDSFTASRYSSSFMAKRVAESGNTSMPDTALFYILPEMATFPPWESATTNRLRISP
jgi:hypothetical protein